MVSLNSFDEISKNSCKYNVNCEKPATNQCKDCGEAYCLEHYSEHFKNLQEHFQQTKTSHHSLYQEVLSLISKFSPNEILDLVKQIHDFKVKVDITNERIYLIEQRLKILEDDDRTNCDHPSITITNDFETDKEVHLENQIELFQKDIDEQRLILEEINHYNQEKASKEESCLSESIIKSNSQSELMNSGSTKETSSRKLSRLKTVFSLPRISFLRQPETSSTLSNLLVKQLSPAMIDINSNEWDFGEEEAEDLLKEEGMTACITPDSTPRNGQKVRLSNNIVNCLKGPLKVMVDGTMHAVEICAQGTQLNDAIKRSVEEAYQRQSELTREDDSPIHFVRPTFTKISSDWITEGKNSDQGFSSPSIWMRDPQGQRVLIKIHEHPMGAANEWLAFALGGLMSLPVNEVQIAMHEDNLVSIHTDVSQKNEKTMTFMDLPKRIKKLLLSDPTLQCMDLFDHILQNVDRNPRNILITMPEAASINDDDVTKLKIHLIDHSSCFGLGKLNFLSIVACKFHSQHLAVVKFDPTEKAKRFEQYLSKFPVQDRRSMRKTLNRFAGITNEQFDYCLNEIGNLLSTSQFDRIRDILYRQRDITKRYLTQWGIDYSISANFDSNSTKTELSVDQLSMTNEQISMEDEQISFF